jgi:hypothetical protein
VSDPSAALLDRLPLDAAKWVLDLGAGTGAHLEPLAARAPAGVMWREELDAIGAVPDPRDPILMQQQRMDSADKLSALLRTAGFGVVQSWTQVFEHRWTIDAVVDAQLGCGMAARRIGSLSRSDAARCEAHVRERMAKLGPDALVYRPEILFATASVQH